MDHTNTSSGHTTLRPLIQLSELKNYHNLTSTQIALSSEILGRDYSTDDVHNDSILYPMEGNNTFGKIEENLINTSGCVQQNISLNNDN